ncbi:MAG TPA: hypothetical protein VJ242_01655 [Patescibacteria group bacterium]|nr:hypothetical protein [Patescibacteria group bacterium]
MTIDAEAPKPISLRDRWDGFKLSQAAGELLATASPTIDRLHTKAIAGASMTFNVASETIFDHSYAAPDTGIVNLFITYALIMEDSHDYRQVIVKSREKGGKEYEALFDQMDGGRFKLTYVEPKDFDFELTAIEKRRILKEMTTVIKFVNQANAAEGNYQD